MNSALILFAHGARDPEWAAPLRQVQTLVAQQLGGEQRVELAFLEFMAPDLPSVVARLVEEGVRSLHILPMFMAQGGHLKHDLPQLLANLRLRYPQVSIVLQPPVGEHPAVLQAMAGVAAQCLGVD